jgi:hypothetical protein
LKVGDLLLAKIFDDQVNNRRNLSSLPIHEVDLLTVSALIDSVRSDLKLRDIGTAAVDMERNSLRAPMRGTISTGCA